MSTHSDVLDVIRTLREAELRYADAKAVHAFDTDALNAEAHRVLADAIPGIQRAVPALLKVTDTLSRLAREDDCCETLNYCRNSLRAPLVVNS